VLGRRRRRRPARCRRGIQNAVDRELIVSAGRCHVDIQCKAALVKEWGNPLTATT